MRRLLVCSFILTVLIGMSCKSAPETAEIEPMTDPDDALRQVYGTYQPMLDMSNSVEYTVRWGDTLSKITRRYYGDLLDVGDAGARNGFYFPVIIMASAECCIVDPDLIVAGTELKIIDLERNLANPECRQAIKNSLKEVAYIYNSKHKPMEEAGLMRLSESL